MIVDDSAVLRRSLRSTLERVGDWYVCGEAENGREGIEKALQLRPDLILLDLSMPVMNGFQAARELRVSLPNVPILMYTSFINPYIEREALASGAAAVRSKTDSFELLYGSIDSLLSVS